MHNWLISFVKLAACVYPIRHLVLAQYRTDASQHRPDILPALNAGWDSFNRMWMLVTARKRNSSLTSSISRTLLAKRWYKCAQYTTPAAWNELYFYLPTCFFVLVAFIEHVIWHALQVAVQISSRKNGMLKQGHFVANGVKNAEMRLISSGCICRTQRYTFSALSELLIT